MNKQQRLQHLYWRSGFGMSPKEWFTKKNHSTQIVIDELFRKAHQFSKKKILKNERGIEPSDILMILKLDKKRKKEAK